MCVGVLVGQPRLGDTVALRTQEQVAAAMICVCWVCVCWVCCWMVGQPRLGDLVALQTNELTLSGLLRPPYTGLVGRSFGIDLVSCA